MIWIPPQGPWTLKPTGISYGHMHGLEKGLKGMAADKKVGKTINHNAAFVTKIRELRWDAFQEVQKHGILPELSVLS